MSQLTRNIASMYPPRLAGIAASVFLFSFVTHHVGLTHYGLWLVISSTTFLFMTDFGMGISAIRYVAEARARLDHDELNRVVSSTLAFFAALGIVAAIAFAAVMVLLIPSLGVHADDRGLAVVLISTVAVGQLLLGLPLGVFRSVLFGARRYDVVNVIALCHVLLRCGLIVGLLLNGMGIVAVALTEAGTTVAGGIATFVLARRLVPELRLSRRLVDLQLLRSMASYSLQVFVIGISALVILQSDSLLIGLFMPVGMVALYMAAYRIYQTCRELAGSLLQPLIPDAAHARTLGYSGRLRRLFLDGTKYANALVLAFSVPTFVFAGPVLDAWVGPRFDSVAVVTQILLVALVINSNHFVAGALLTGMGRIARYARYHVAWAVSNVAVTVVLINQIGLRGVALGTALPLLVLEPLYVRTALREFELTAGVFLRRCVMPALGPAAGAGALLAVIALGFEPHDLVTVVGSSLAYLVMFIVLFARWGLSSSERASMARLVRRVGPAPAY